MSLTQQQVSQVAQLAALNLFVAANVTASYNVNDLTAAVTAIDNAFDTPLSTAVTAVGGAMSIINALGSAIPAPFSAATTQQKTILACLVLEKRAGII